MLYSNLLLFGDTDGPFVEPPAAESPEIGIISNPSLKGVKVLGNETHPLSKTGLIAPNIKDILFNEVHFFPTTNYNLGVLFSDLINDIYIWNTLSSNISLSEVISTDLNGVQVVISLGTIQPFEILQGELQLSTVGTPSVNGSLEFVTSERSILVLVSFLRALVIPFMIDDLDSLKISYGFSTVINTTKYQKEQRRNLYEKPQRKIEYSLLETSSNKMLIKNLSLFGKDKTFIVPMYMEMIDIVSANSNVITVSTDFTSFWNLTMFCSILFVYDFENNTSYIYEISSLSPSTNEITTPYPIAESLSNKMAAFPAFIGTLNNSTLNNNTDLVGSFSLSFSELVGSNQPVLGTLPSIPSLFNLPPNWENSPRETFEPIREIVNYTGTASQMYALVARGQNLFNYEYQFDHDEILDFLNYFTYVKGRYKSFYFKTWTQMAIVHADVLDSDTNIVIEYNGLDLTWYTGMKVVIEVGSNSFEREITSVSGRDSYGLQIIQISSPLGIPVDKDSIFIYDKKKVRFGTDVVEFQFPSILRGTTSLEFVELIQEV